MDQSSLVSLLFSRKIADFPIGNIPLKVHHKRLDSRWLYLPEAWISPDEVTQMDEHPEVPVLVDADNAPLCWLSHNPACDLLIPVANSFLIRYPWDILRANELYLGSLKEDRILGKVHENATINGTVHIGPGTEILPGVVIEGNVVIGANCKIGPNCYLRGNTAIGDNCHVGNAVEIKNSILLNHSSVGHLSYIGDSILGEHANIGAGTITANYRHDEKNHHCLIDGKKLDTSRRKLGAFIGDRVHTGINTSIYPGRILAAGTTTLPGQVVRENVM